MNKTLLATALIAALPLAAQADTIGFKIGAYSWQQNYEGEALSSNNLVDRIDVEDDLGFEDETGNSFYLAIEHPIPLLPNIMLEHTELDVTETNDLTRTFRFDGVDFGDISIVTPITSTSDLTHTDATLYYEILDNWVSLDLGLTIRQFSEGLELRSNSGNATLDLDATVPMIYLAAKFELPLTGLYIGAQAKGIGYSDGSLTDLRASLGYETSLGLGVEIGLRSFEIDYEDDDEEANLTIDGAFAGVYYHF